MTNDQVLSSNFVVRCSGAATRSVSSGGGTALPYTISAPAPGWLPSKPTLSGQYTGPADSSAIMNEDSRSADQASEPDSLMIKSTLCMFVFAVRCSGAATISYLAAAWMGLSHPIWAPITALIISQERLQDTESSLLPFIVGTFIGSFSAVITSALGSWFAANVGTQIAAGVTFCALVAHAKPSLRVCMWTCPMVLLTSDASDSAAVVALDRGGEVVVGALIGAGLHWMAESRLLADLSQRLGLRTLVQ